MKKWIHTATPWTFTKTGRPLTQKQVVYNEVFVFKCEDVEP